MAKGVFSASALYTQIIDTKTGQLTQTGIKLFQAWAALLAGGFDPSGALISNINPKVQIVGRDGTIGGILRFLEASGVIDPAGLPAATATEQGAVVMPAGATSNILGTAATQPVGAFDPAGAAASAQSGAETFASGEAATAQANAEAHSDAALAAAFASGITGTVALAKLTLAGSDGSLTFTNGLITGKVDPT